MSLRGKRPLDSRSRGDSPPDKRSRPPEPRPALQDRYADTIAPVVLSPPPSRKSSFAGLPPKPLTGSRLSPDHHRPDLAAERSLRQEQGRDNPSFIDNVRNRSPSSITSGASTPTGQAALPVPSMLPLAVSRQHQDEAAGPVTIQALRKLKARRKEIASHAHAAVTTPGQSSAPTASTPKSLEVQLKVHQLDIAQLKKERDELINRLKRMEASVQRLDGQEDVSTEVQTLKNRVNSIEAFSLGTELPSLRTGIEELKPSLNSIANLSNLEQQVLQLKPVLDKIDNFDKSLVSRISSLEQETEQLKSLSRVDQLANTSSSGGSSDQTALKQIASLKKEFTSQLNREKNAQTLQITKLEHSINALPKPFPEQHIRDLVLEEVVTKTDDAKRIIRNEYKAVEKELRQIITNAGVSLSEVKTQVGLFQTFKETIEKQNIAAQFKNFQDRLENADLNNSKTFGKIDKLTQNYERFKKRTDDEIHHLREDLFNDLFDDLKDKFIDDLYDDLYDNLSKSLSKSLSKELPNQDHDFRTTTEDAIKKLTRNGDHLLNDTSIFDSVHKLTGRLDELENKEDAVEKIARKPKFSKVGMRPAPSSPSSNDNSVGESSPNSSSQRIGRLEADLNDLRQALDKVKDFTADVAAIQGRLEKFEATSEGLSKLEQQVAEHESLRSSLTALDTRFTDSIQALQQAQSTRSAIAQPHVAGPSSAPEGAASNAVPDILDQFSASMNGLADEVERIDSELNNALMAINAQGVIIKSLENTVPNLFREQFDPFKTKTEEQISALDGNLEQYQQNMVSLRQEMLALQAQPQQTTFGSAQQTQLKYIITETNSLKRDLSVLQSALSTKVDSTTHDNHIKSINFAFSNLEARYDNITTEELYKRIVRWFIQTYPDTSSLLTTSRSISQMVQDIDQLKHSHGQVAWVQTYASDIQSLCRNVTQLQELASNSSQLRELLESPRQSSEMLTKIDVACTNAESAFNMAEQGLERMDEQGEKLADFEKCIEGLQSSIRVLTPNIASLVKPAELNDLTTRLEQRIDQVQGELSSEMQELRGSSDKIQGLCVSSQANVEELRKRSDSQATELRKISDVKLAELQSKLTDFEGTCTISESRIQELEKSHSILDNKVDNSRKDSDKTIETLRTELDNEAREMYANLEAVKEELLAGVGADKKDSLAKIVDAKTELLAKINDTRTELLGKVDADLVAKLGIQKKVLLSKIETEKQDLLKKMGEKSDDVRTQLVATLDARVKELPATINPNQEASLTTVEGNKNELLEKLGAETKTLLGKIATERREAGVRMQTYQSKRERAEDGLRELINNAKDDANQNVAGVQESLDTLRTEFHTLNQLVEPNKTFLGSLGSLYVVVVQLQQLFESLNQNTGVAPLEFNWAYYLANLLPERKPNGAGSRRPSLA